jgi:hypothetical protein
MSLAKNALNAMVEGHPNLFKLLEKYLLRKHIDGFIDFDEWPEYCFAPFVFYIMYYMLEFEREGIELNLQEKSNRTEMVVSSSHIFVSMVPWNYSKSTYVFDKDLYNEIISMDLNGSLPIEVFYRLPEWSVYIKTHDMKMDGLELDGFFCSIEVGYRPNKDRLAFIAIEKDLTPSYFSIPLDGTSIKDIIFAEANPLTPEQRVSEVKFITPILSLVLYLCSGEPDLIKEKQLTDASKLFKKTRKGFRLFAAIKERTWDVGKTIGDTIREGRLRAKGGSVAPHLRRAHWHGYWTGPRDKEQVFKYNWIPPVFIEGNKVGLDER